MGSQVLGIIALNIGIINHIFPDKKCNDLHKKIEAILLHIFKSVAAQKRFLTIPKIERETKGQPSWMSISDCRMKTVQISEMPLNSFKSTVQQDLDKCTIKFNFERS